MIKFQTEQKIYEIGNVRIGGQPGQLPLVLIGNVFYKGMPEITDHKEGRFDEEKVETWIQVAEELSKETGVPHIIDITALYPKAMEKYVRFVVERTENPISINGANAETRITGLKIAEELGIQEKVIFNGISPQTESSEIEKIRECQVKAAILIASNDYDFSPAGRVSALKGTEYQPSLLEIAKKAGIEKMLIDTIVFDIPSIAYAAEAVKLVKEEFGFPAGCSPANATFDWRKRRKESFKEGFAACNATAHSLVQFWGADFLLYGPIKQAKNIIPATAVNDSIIAYYAMKNYGIRPLVESHPIYKIF